MGFMKSYKHFDILCQNDPLAVYYEETVLHEFKNSSKFIQLETVSGQKTKYWSRKTLFLTVCVLVILILNIIHLIID